jgi:hypothetical protein
MKKLSLLPNRLRQAAKFGLLGVLGMLLLSGFSSAFSQKIKKNSTLPPGRYTLSASPYLGDSYNAAPVLAYAVRSKSGDIISVKLATRLPKEVVAIGLKWIATDDEARRNERTSGEVRWINTKGHLDSKRRRLEVKFGEPFFSFAQSSPALLKKGETELNGQFNIAVKVVGARYEDGSTWSEGEAVPELVNLSSTNPQAPCARQTCVIDGSGTFFTCQQTNHNTNCTNSSDATSCTITICGSSTGGGGGVGECGWWQWWSTCYDEEVVNV